MLHLKDFDYNLPKELIAQRPVKPRDHSRLLALHKDSGEIEHKRFYDIVDYLKKGDVLVLNNSKVFPARLIGKKAGTGGKIEVFLLKRIRGALWQCLLGGHGRKEGLEVEFGRGLRCGIVKNNNDGTWGAKFNKSGKKLMDVVNKIGEPPLPPYIKRSSKFKVLRPIRPGRIGRKNSKLIDDRKNYQTVYADNKKIGSVAAPTAGFHFTPELIKKLKAKGARIEYITLHVGLGTFAPVKVDNIAKHKMHEEYAEIKNDVIKRIIKAKQEGRRIVAVGTTSVRTLEACFLKIPNPKSQIPNKFKIPNPKFKTNIFIYPGYKFKIIDAMITNFHLPKSTLLMLVSAFAGKKNIDKAYKTAIKNKYRFYSYGDAMLISND